MTTPTQRRDELTMELEWLDVRERFVAAKETKADNPEEYAAAKAAMSEMRTFWRQVGESVGTRTPGGAVATADEETPS